MIDTNSFNLDQSEILFNELNHAIVNIYKTCLEEMGYDLYTTNNYVEYHNYLINNPIKINVGGGGYYGEGAMISGGQVTNPLELNIAKDANTYHLVLWRYAEFATYQTGVVSGKGRANGKTLEGVIYEYETNNVLAYTIEDSADTTANRFYNDTDTFLIPGGNSWPNESEVHRGQSAYCAKLAGGRGGFGDAMGKPGTMLAVQCSQGCLLHYGKDVGYSLGCMLLGEKAVNGTRPNFTKEEWLPSNIFTTTAPNASFWKNLYDHVVPAICSGKKVALHIRKRIGSMSSTGATMGSGGGGGTPASGLVSLYKTFTNAGFSAGKDFVIRPVYSTPTNFCGRVLNGYRPGQSDLWASSSLANALVKAIPKFKDNGWIMCIWDAYRPQRGTKDMGNFAADHNISTSVVARNRSFHNSGDAADLTALDKNGNYISMVSAYFSGHGRTNGGFDDFYDSKKGVNLSYCSYKGSANQAKLRNLMTGVGLKGIGSEWWHFYSGSGASTIDVPY